MSGMKQWEREIIEYRPYLGLHRDILSSVMSRGDEDGRIPPPTQIVKRAASILGVDVIENIIASLNRITRLLDMLEASLANDPTFLAYKQALKEKDIIKARDIYTNHLVNIHGNPDFDAYPILLDAATEIQNYLKFLNGELYGGKGDFNNLTELRGWEEDRVLALVQIESEDLQPIVLSDLTPDERRILEKIIWDSGGVATTEEEYMEFLTKEKYKNGSSRINYDEVAVRTQVIAVANEKSKLFKQIADNTDAYINTRMEEHLGGDMKGSLGYLVNLEDNLSDIKDTLAMGFDNNARKSQDAFINQVRLTNQTVREFLDQKLQQVRKKKEKTTQKVKKFYDPDVKEVGAQFLMGAIADGVDATNNLWTVMLSEHIGATEMAVDQYEQFFGHLEGKRRSQELYKYVDVVDKEFDYENKEKEMQNFLTFRNW